MLIIYWKTWKILTRRRHCKSSKFIPLPIQVSETMAASNGFISAGYEDAEDKPMLLMKNPNDGHGLTALINRQLQGKCH